MENDFIPFDKYDSEIYNYLNKTGTNSDKEEYNRKVYDEGHEIYDKTIKARDDPAWLIAPLNFDKRNNTEQLIRKLIQTLNTLAKKIKKSLINYALGGKKYSDGEIKDRSIDDKLYNDYDSACKFFRDKTYEYIRAPYLEQNQNELKNLYNRGLGLLSMHEALKYFPEFMSGLSIIKQQLPGEILKQMNEIANLYNKNKSANEAGLETYKFKVNDKLKSDEGDIQYSFDNVPKINETEESDDELIKPEIDEETKKKIEVIMDPQKIPKLEEVNLQNIRKKLDKCKNIKEKISKVLADMADNKFVNGFTKLYDNFIVQINFLEKAQIDKERTAAQKTYEETFESYMQKLRDLVNKETFNEAAYDKKC